jgi:hypothetical protein
MTGLTEAVAIADQILELIFRIVAGIGSVIILIAMLKFANDGGFNSSIRTSCK